VILVILQSIVCVNFVPLLVDCLESQYNDCSSKFIWQLFSVAYRQVHSLFTNMRLHSWLCRLRYYHCIAMQCATISD